MNVNDIETRVRRILNDDTEPYRWTHDAIRDDVHDAIIYLHSIRPETRFVNGKLNDYVELPTDDGANIDVEQRFFEGIVFYVVHKCYLSDDPDTINANLSESYLAKAKERFQL